MKFQKRETDWFGVSIGIIEKPWLFYIHDTAGANFEMIKIVSLQNIEYK